MDLAIIKKTEEKEQENPQLTDLPEHYVKVDEISFDFRSHIYCNTTSYICSLLSINCPPSV